MDENLDLWGDITDNGGLTHGVISLIEQQAKQLEIKTNGIIKALFKKVQYQASAQSALKSTLSMLHVATSLVADNISKENDENCELENADKLYEAAKYKFEIYSDKFKYRLFYLQYKSIYPINIEVEYGIIKDDNCTITLNNLADLKTTLKEIFMSNKVRFIIQKMLEESGSKN